MGSWVVRLVIFFWRMRIFVVLLVCVWMFVVILLWLIVVVRKFFIFLRVGVIVFLFERDLFV